MQYNNNSNMSTEYDLWPVRKTPEIYEKWVLLNVENKILRFVMFEGKEVDDITDADRLIVETTYVNLYQEIFNLKSKLKDYILKRDIRPFFSDAMKSFLNSIFNKER
jgi:hypothetical protein